MRVPAAEIEYLAIGQIRRLLCQPEMVVAVWKRLRQTGRTEREVRDALLSFNSVWEELFPAQQSRIVQLLIDRVVVAPDRADVHLRVEGFKSLVEEISPAAAATRSAA